MYKKGKYLINLPPKTTVLFPYNYEAPLLQYFKTSLKTRISMVYIETWEAEDQAPGISKQVTINKVSSLLHTLVFCLYKVSLHLHCSLQYFKGTHIDLIILAEVIHYRHFLLLARWLLTTLLSRRPRFEYPAYGTLCHQGPKNILKITITCRFFKIVTQRGTMKTG